MVQEIVEEQKHVVEIREQAVQTDETRLSAPLFEDHLSYMQTNQQEERSYCSCFSFRFFKRNSEAQSTDTVEEVSHTVVEIGQRRNSISNAQVMLTALREKLRDNTGDITIQRESLQEAHSALKKD